MSREATPQTSSRSAASARGRTARAGAIGRKDLFARPSAAGMLLGAAAFVAGLMPGMVPRSELLQGALAGLAFGAGYGAGAALSYLLRLFELDPDRWPHVGRARWIAFAASAGIVLFGLTRASGWQDAVRAVMDLPPVEEARPVLIAALAICVAGGLVLLGRLFRRLWLTSARLLVRVLPIRLALLAGFLLASAFFWGVGSGVILRKAVDGLDATYAQVDRVTALGGGIPADPLKSGSAASGVAWRTMGATGRAFVAGEPDRTMIEGLTGRAAKEPIRVYVGINSAEDIPARAQLALAELQRTGAFDRETLVIATPTGTGWVDPAAMQPLEYVLEGDVATVAVQYSYLPSWLSLLVEPDRGAETARQVFRTIYAHWTTLPPDRRPRLYLFGLSLGALNSDLSVDVYDIMAQPFHGALWVGPPFASRTWRTVTQNRNPGTPVWHPRYSDGRMFRFATQDTDLASGHAPWGPVRIVYLQYASDPIVFFERSGLFRRPALMAAPRAADVAPGLVWVPVVSFLQSILDMVTAAGAPRGYGHVYAASHYLDAWLALTEPEGLEPATIARLREHLASQGL